MRVYVLTPAEVEPLTVAQAKDYCRVTHTLEDDLFPSLISSARELCEQASRVPISLQTFRAEYRWPKMASIFGLRSQLDDPDHISKGVLLPRRPVVSVDAVVLVREDGTIKTLDLSTNEYRIAGDRLYVIIDPHFNEGYTSLIVDFGAGWPAIESDPETLPEDVVAACPELHKQCVRDAVAHLYRNRGDELAALPKKVTQMLSAYADIGGYAG